ncbi:MAG: lamin tail domain-containing protein [Verrucomicrobiota bacterium]
MVFKKLSASARVAVLIWIGCRMVQAAPDSVVTFNELHYHPQDPAAPEWVELHNQMSIRVNLGGWTIRGGIDYQFPENTVLEAGAKLVVSAMAGTPAGALGPFTGKLDNKGEEVTLHERWGRLMDRITYTDADPWPAAADGGGFTLAKKQPNALSDEPGNWRTSAAVEGTPGAENFPAVAESTPRYAAVAGTEWRYDPGTAAPPAEWIQLTGFDENSWTAGTAPLATAAQATTLLPAGRTVYRFRKTFGYTGGLENGRVLLTGQLKGSAAIWLNGAPQGTFTGNGDFAVTLKSETLAVGADVVALEVTPQAAGGEVALDLAVTLIDGATGVVPAPAPHTAGPVVINEISYHARPTYPEPLNSVKYAENPAEWIEFFNRGAVPADLTGWRLRGEVDYDFPAGTVLAAGGYLVVNQTQFSGSLSNQSGTVRLRDALGGIADEMRYFDSGRWPGAADGGGSTLELKDPSSDNRAPESWAASDETAKTAWQTVSYRSTGAEPPGSNNPSTWREFLFGMLEAGEVLIDDVSVIEDPDGVKKQLIQNGTFEADPVGGGAAKWRLLGTHKLSRVEASGTGKVLHLIATNEMEHSYNCASTTLVGNAVISNTRTYEISYRARWLSGSPQLNSRLYLNRAARTTILAQPPVAGTPGAPNSTLTANAGPAFQNLRHSPLVPAASQAVRVSAAVNDPDGLASVRLFYSVGATAWKSVPMGGDPDGTFFGVIPGQTTNSLVQFYVEATDGKGAMTWFPKNGAASRAVYRVGDGGISTQTVRNKMRLFMTAADANNLHEISQSTSNYRWPCTVIYNDQEVWYDAGVRLRSAPYGRQGVRAGWNIVFGNDAPFRGVQKSVVIDGAFNMPKTDGSGWTENSLGASVNEMLFQAVSNRAGGIAATYDDIVYFQTPRTVEGNRRAQLKMTRFGSNFLEEFIPDGDKGSLYKQELIYYPTTTLNGNPEGVKNAYNAVLDTEIKSFGTSPDSYRFNYLHENLTEKDDYSSIMALGTAFFANSANLPAATAATMDVDNWMRTYALIALTGLADTYNSGLAHNIELYARPDNGKVMLFPWDQDHAFYYGPTSSIFGGGSHRLATIIQLPAYKRIYCANLLDLCNTAFTNTYLDPVINHLNSVAGKDSYSATFRNYVTQRRTYVMAQVKAAYPAVAFSITTGGGADFSVATPSTVIEGQGGIDVRDIRVSRNGGAPVSAAVTWLDAKRWRITVPLPPGANALTFTAFDVAGTALAPDTITVTNTGAVAPADASNLVISEINYHPVISGEEFVELLNTSAGTIDLAGLRFTAGISFSFPVTTVPLAAGQRLLLVQNRAAFEAKYGTGLPIAGEFSVLTGLSNSGDRLTLLDLAGAVIADFSYGDSLPWPEEADGGGYSLTRIAGSTGDPGNESLWRPSSLTGGTPGTSDRVALSLYPNILDYAVITAPAPSVSNGARTVTWTERLGADDARIIPEVSANLTTWQTDPGDGSLLETVSTTSADRQRVRTVRLAPGMSFLRLRVVPR